MRSTSGTYSFVSWPHSRTLNDFSFSRVGVIFNTVYLLSILSTLQGQGHNHNQEFPRNECLLILRLLILDSNVDAGMPRIAAAPSGPEMRPRVSFKTASRRAFCCSRDFGNPESVTCEVLRNSSGSVPGSSRNTAVSAKITPRSITFCNSRMFPGHE